MDTVLCSDEITSRRGGASVDGLPHITQLRPNLFQRPGFCSPQVVHRRCGCRSLTMTAQRRHTPAHSCCWQGSASCCCLCCCCCLTADTAVVSAPSRNSDTGAARCTSTALCTQACSRAQACLLQHAVCVPVWEAQHTMHPHARQPCLHSPSATNLLQHGGPVVSSCT